MIYFYWMEIYQSQHRKKELAFKKALEYLKHNGIEKRRYVDFLDTKNEDDQGSFLNVEFDKYLYNNNV